MNEKKIKLKTGEIWQERLVAGNGHSGVICSCEPYEEVLTYQNIELLMPTEEPRMTPPEVGSELQEARQAVLHMDDTWNVHGRKRTYLSPGDATSDHDTAAGDQSVQLSDGRRDRGGHYGLSG